MKPVSSLADSIAVIEGLSDFAVVAIAEDWSHRFEENYEQFAPNRPAVPGYTVGEIEGFLADPDFAERGLPRERSPAIARLILLAVARTDALRPQLKQTLDEFRDDNLKAGATLRIATVAIALLALSSSTPVPEASPQARVETIIGSQLAATSQEGTPAGDTPGLLAALDWLVGILNNRELTAVLNAIAIGGLGKGVHAAIQVRRRAGRSFLQLSSGKEIEIPLKKEADVVALLGGPLA